MLPVVEVVIALALLGIFLLLGSLEDYGNFNVRCSLELHHWIGWNGEKVSGLTAQQNLRINNILKNKQMRKLNQFNARDRLNANPCCYKWNIHSRVAKQQSGGLIGWLVLV